MYKISKTCKARQQRERSKEWEERLSNIAEHKPPAETKRSIKDIRSDKILDTAIDVNGKVTTRRKRIDDKLMSGFRVKMVDGKRRFTDGKSYFDESDLTKTEMDYAEKCTLENNIPDVDSMIGKKYEAFGTTFTIVGQNKNGYDAKGEDGTTDEIGPVYAEKHVTEYEKKSNGATSVKPTAEESCY